MLLHSVYVYDSAILYYQMLQKILPFRSEIDLNPQTHREIVKKNLVKRQEQQRFWTNLTSKLGNLF